MIVEAVINVLVALVSGILSLVPDFEAPSWLTGSGSGTLGGYANTVGQAMGKAEPWLPLDALGYAVTIVVAAVAFSVAVRVVRILLSLFTGGGGGAA